MERMVLRSVVGMVIVAHLDGASIVARVIAAAAGSSQLPRSIKLSISGRTITSNGAGLL